MSAGALPAKMLTLTAERLVQEAQAYSRAAWAQIYDQYYPKIFDYCYLRTSDRAGAEDLASEVFLEALRGIGRYRYRGLPFSAWLYRIARNLTADQLRRSARRPTVSLPDENAHAQLQTPDVSDAAILWHDVHDAMQRLTDDQQQVIILRFFQGFSHEETGAIMGRRSGAVRALQARALQTLRTVMAEPARR